MKQVIIEYCNEPRHIGTDKEKWTRHGTYDYDTNSKSFVQATSIHWRVRQRIEENIVKGETEGREAELGGVYRWQA